MTCNRLSSILKRDFLTYSLTLLFIIAASGCGGGGGGSDDESVLPETPQLSFVDTCESLRESQPVGLACLHCSQPQAHAQARVLAELKVRSCVRNIATNYLVDGTFGYDENFLVEQIDTLTQNDRNWSVTFFLANGPAQRDFDDTVINSFGTKISPADFRERIISDRSLRGEFTQIVRRLRPLVRRALNQGATVTVIPQLEDNLNNAAFEAMARIIRSNLSDRRVRIGRNPCYDNQYPFVLEACTVGAEVDVPEGVVTKAHSSGPFTEVVQGIVSNDGIEYESPALGSVDSAQTTVADLKNFRDAVHRLGSTFILWSGQRQGLVGNFQDLPFELPVNRRYPIPSEVEQIELIDFLTGN